MKTLHAVGITLGEIQGTAKGNVQYYNILARDEAGNNCVTMFAAEVCYTGGLIKTLSRLVPITPIEEEKQNAE
jgi:hypothetical protein